MSTLHAEVFEAFRALDVPEEKALRAARALSDAFDRGDADVDTKAAGGITLLRGEMRDGFAKVDAEFAKVDAEFAKVREEVRDGFAKVDAEFARVDTEFGKVRGEMRDGFAKVDTRFDRVRDDIHDLRKEAAVSRWMLATIVALLITLLVRAFLH